MDPYEKPCPYLCTFAIPKLLTNSIPLYMSHPSFKSSNFPPYSTLGQKHIEINMAYEHSIEEEGEEYIDMDISSTSHYQLNKVSSPTNSREFEFPMSFNNTPHKDPVSLASPADELFYKGNLLPLHLPPRLQMVQKLLYETTNQTTTTTPFHSCTISPATSCYVSGELNPDDYFHDIDFSKYFTHPHDHQKKSWSKKFNSKLKASRAYIKSLFIKAKGSSISGFMNSGKKSLYSVAHDGEDSTPRRSFSMSVRRSPKNKCSSLISSSSFSSSSSSSSSSSVPPFLRMHGHGSQGGQMLRSSSVHSEVESSIQGAIAYCKMSGLCGG